MIASADLDQARLAFERLGFTVPPRGSHIQWGTGNLCIMFPDDYLEVRGIIDASKFTMHLDSHLENHGEGLMGVAFGTVDVRDAFETAGRNGIRTGELRELTRNFEHPEGWTQPRFELFAPDAEDIEGLMHVVVIQHLTPELLRRPDFLEHENTCTGVVGMTGTVGNAARTAEKMRALLGDEAVVESEDRVRLTVGGNQWIDLISGDSANAGLYSMTLAVASQDAAISAFERGGVRYETGSDNSISTQVCGTQLDFVQAGSTGN